MNGNRKKLGRTLFICILTIAIVVAAIAIFVRISDKKEKDLAKDTLFQYFALIKEENYDQLYEKISQKSQEKITKEDFIARNKNIYSGIDLQDIKIEIQEIEKNGSKRYLVSYQNQLMTSAGEIKFSNTAYLQKEEKEYRVEWSSNLILKDLGENEKVRVKILSAKRGNIYDRNNNLLAGEGKVASIGFVPGKMNEDATEDIQKIADLLDMSTETIHNLLNASYVKDDTFVLLRNIRKDQTELIDQVLEVKGIKVNFINSRVYPYGEATSHLTGYIQSISSEELKNHLNEGYTSTSVIGKTGLERAYESKLRGIDGCEIYIIDVDGNKKETIATRALKDGQDVKLTLDASLQEQLYNKYCFQKGFFVVMHPKTGEILALISTPSYNANDFTNGISNKQWKSLNEDTRKPLYNRYLSTWCPGSIFKSITALIGVDLQKIDPNEDFGHSGYAWKKDESWGDYQITTLQEYFEPAILQNALKYSDNIYFAKAGLKIGATNYIEYLEKLGFNESMPFEQALNPSIFSTTNELETEIKLADSAYGQGQVLLNPLHMASIYSMFVNDGNMVLPYLEYREDNTPKYFKEGVVSKETASTVKECLIQVVESPDATAHRLKVYGKLLGAKTGTAELKDSKEDVGNELSWLVAFTADESEKKYLVIAMREDDKTESFSLFPIVRSIFEE